MREIKFRGKSLVTGEWVYGYYFHEPDLNGHFILQECTLTQHEVIPETVGQFTGLHDKDIREIYEGDKVGDCVTTAVLVVMFGHNKHYTYTGWYCKYLDIDVQDTRINGDYDTGINKHIEIIGNIHD